MPLATKQFVSNDALMDASEVEYLVNEHGMVVGIVEY